MFLKKDIEKIRSNTTYDYCYHTVTKDGISNKHSFSNICMAWTRGLRSYGNLITWISGSSAWPATCSANMLEDYRKAFRYKCKVTDDGSLLVDARVKRGFLILATCALRMEVQNMRLAQYDEYYHACKDVSPLARLLTSKMYVRYRVSRNNPDSSGLQLIEYDHHSSIVFNNAQSGHTEYRVAYWPYVMFATKNLNVWFDTEYKDELTYRNEDCDNWFRKQAIDYLTKFPDAPALSKIYGSPSELGQALTNMYNYWKEHQ